MYYIVKLKGYSENNAVCSGIFVDIWKCLCKIPTSALQWNYDGILIFWCNIVYFIMISLHKQTGINVEAMLDIFLISVEYKIKKISSPWILNTQSLSWSLPHEKIVESHTIWWNHHGTHQILWNHYVPLTDFVHLPHTSHWSLIHVPPTCLSWTSCGPHGCLMYLSWNHHAQFMDLFRPHGPLTCLLWNHCIPLMDLSQISHVPPMDPSHISHNSHEPNVDFSCTSHQSMY